MRRLVVTCVLAGCLANSAEPQAQTPDTRASLIQRAQVWFPTHIAEIDLERGPRGEGAFAQGELIRCDHTDTTMNGNSPKVCLRPSRRR